MPDWMRKEFDQEMERRKQLASPGFQAGLAGVLEDLKNWQGVQQWEMEKAIDQPIDEAKRANGRYVFPDPVSAREAFDQLMGFGVGDMGKPAMFAQIFAGKGAKTADLATLAKAEDMARKGLGREQIWNDTGWWQGKDRQWRFEIPDDEARYNLAIVHEGENFSSSDWNNNGFNKWVQRIFSKQQADTIQEKFPDQKPKEYALDQWLIGGDVDKGVPAEVLLEHPRFERAYPDLKITADESPWLDSLASYYEGPNGGMMTLRGDGAGPAFADRNKNFMLHELQHAVQDREGFASGGNLDSVLNDLKQNDPELYRVYERTHELGKLASDRYKRLAGEAEARLVQARMNMSPQERKARPPWTMFDVPEDEQIVRFLGGR